MRKEQIKLKGGGGGQRQRDRERQTDKQTECVYVWVCGCVWCGGVGGGLIQDILNCMPSFIFVHVY